MKTKFNRTYIIILGVVVAICLLLGNVKAISSQESTSAKVEEDVIAKYKSTVPLVTTPLQILAKGLSIINK